MSARDPKVRERLPDNVTPRQRPEKGGQQPRSLAQAFLRGVTADAKKGESTLTRAIGELDKRRQNFDKVYGACADTHFEINVESGEGTLLELVDFVAD